MVSILKYILMKRGESKMNEYEKFQEWLNNCPVKIIDYEDLTDQFQVTFEVPLENEEEK